MPTPSTRLLVLRHGESEWNVAGRWQGTADPPLTAAGRVQAAAAAAVLGQFEAIWSSDLQRAAATAEIIADRLGVGPAQFDARLRETGVGEWEGLTHGEIEAGWPGYIAGDYRPAGFEPLDKVVERVTSCMLDMASATPGGEVLVVSHAGVIRTMRRALGASDERFGNLGGCWFSVDQDGRISAGDPVLLIELGVRVSDSL